MQYSVGAFSKCEIPQEPTQRVNMVIYCSKGGIFDRSWVAAYSLGRLPLQPTVRGQKRTGTRLEEFV